MFGIMHFSELLSLPYKLIPFLPATNFHLLLLHVCIYSILMLKRLAVVIDQVAVLHELCVAQETKYNSLFFTSYCNGFNITLGL